MGEGKGNEGVNHEGHEEHEGQKGGSAARDRGWIGEGDGRRERVGCAASLVVMRFSAAAAPPRQVLKPPGHGRRRPRARVSRRWRGRTHAASWAPRAEARDYKQAVAGARTCMVSEGRRGGVLLSGGVCLRGRGVSAKETKVKR